MYCRNCGQKLEDGDKFCSSCGAKTILEDSGNNTAAELHTDHKETSSTHTPASEEKTIESEPLFEPFDFSTIDFGLGIGTESETAKAPETKEIKKPVPPVEDFDWNIHTFPGMGVEKTEEIDFNWSMPLEEPEPAVQKTPEPAPKASPEPAAPKQEPEIFSPEGTKWQSVASEKEETPKTEHSSALEDTLFGELDSKADEARKQSEEIDKFFTFHKKNEQFQKLLDQEYEKIKSGNILSEEMNTAAAASEEKFASRKPEDPMEDLFASEGVVKGYEPKPVETDVLERIEAAEAEKKIREESARLIEEEKQKAKEEAEAKAKAEAEAVIKAKEAEEAARLRLEEEAKRAADARAAQEAAEREMARTAARDEAQAAMKAAEEKAEQARLEAEERLAQQTAQLKAEAEERARAEAAKAEAEARERAEAEAKAKAEAERLKAEAEQPVIEEAPQDPVPEKTKAVDKAAILAGMATASEMVERDRAFAAAEAAKAKSEAESAPEPIELPDFLGHLEELEDIEEPEPVPTVEESVEPALEGVEEISFMADSSEPAQDQLFDQADALEEPEGDLLSIEDLLGGEQEAISFEETESEDENTEEAPQEELLVMDEDPVLELFSEESEAPEAPATEQTAAELPEDYNPAEDISETDLKDGQQSALLADFEDDDDEEEEGGGGKGRIVLKVCLVVLIILLVMEIAGVLIKVAAPTSGAAKFIDSQLNKVIHLFTGDDAEYSVLAATEKIRETVIEDKTELIQAEMGKNKDANIKTIAYNKSLKFDPEKEYENTDINLTQNLSDVTWYKNADNKQVYYDQAIVGAVIAYDSQWMNMVNYHDSSVLNLIQKGTDLYKEVKKAGSEENKAYISELQIGEIRQAGSSYFVWVSEKIKDSENGSAKTVKKIYEMTPDNETMKMVASYDI